MIQRAQNIQRNLERNQVEKVMLPDFKTYYKATLIKTVWYRYKDQQID